MGLLDGKVVLVTGAGGGIGRCHALACAREGARVVVNDLGGARDGTGADGGPAARVVEEIQASGGEALAHVGSVVDLEACEAAVQAALDRWGRLDVLVNNAGILRDKTFAKMSLEDWDAVLAVHLGGTRNMCRAALPALVARGGAIVNTTSYSGLIGNFGQSNYAAAKAGIYGLTRVLALELRKHGVTANCVSPVAKTRMTTDIPMVDDAWTPEQISPVVVFLASDLARDVTGKVFGVQGNRIHAYEMTTTAGAEKAGGGWTAPEIAARLPEIFGERAAPGRGGVDDGLGDLFGRLPDGFRPELAAGLRAVVHWRVDGGPDQTLVVEEGRCRTSPGLVGRPTCTVAIGRDDLLGLLTGVRPPPRVFAVGRASADNMAQLVKVAACIDWPAVAALADERHRVAPEGPPPTPIGRRYEGGTWIVTAEQLQAYAAATDDENPAYRGERAVAPPMFHVRPFIDLMQDFSHDPDLALDVLRLVHGEHAMRFHRPLRPGDALHMWGTLESVDEKASGKVLAYGLFGEVDGERVCEGTTTYFVRAPAGSASTPKKPRAAEAAPPPPSWTSALRTTPDQALRYAEASGDHNRIHTDPETARAAGLDGCILHGLCTMALAARDLVDRYADGDPARLASLSVRWSRPVYPGETLTLQVWERGGGELAFIVNNGDGKPVVTNGSARVRV